VSTLVALLHVAAQSGGAAGSDVLDHAPLLGAESSELRVELLEEIGQFQARRCFRFRLGCRSQRRAHRSTA
jgi:hypothetical protein